MKSLKRKNGKYAFIFVLFLLFTQNVYAITSSDVIYNNDGTNESLTKTLDDLYKGLNTYKTGGTVKSNQMLKGATGYAQGSLVTGTIESKVAATYQPSTVNQVIEAGQYLSGPQTIQGDANLVAGNIKAGTSIFGVSGTFTSDANAAAANILSGKTAYVNGTKITGTIPSKTAATYTPGTVNQTISAGQHLSGVQTIKGDANLKAANIKKGVSIFGVAGTFTSDANANSGDIRSGKTAYVNGTKVTGSAYITRGDILLQYGETPSSSNTSFVYGIEKTFSFPENWVVYIVTNISNFTVKVDGSVVPANSKWANIDRSGLWNFTVKANQKLSIEGYTIAGPSLLILRIG